MLQPRIVKRRIRLFFQRLFRGWDDSECWSLDHTFARWIVPRLEVFKKSNHGVPDWCFEKPGAVHSDDDINKAFEKWNSIIDEMIIGFQEKQTEWDRSYYSQLNKYERAKELFSKHLDDLWD